MSAVTAKKSSFQVYEEVDTTGEKDPSSYKDILSAELYNLTASYTLFQHHKYYSLDATENQNQIILDIQRDYIDFCADDIATGDFFIASDAAYWFNSNPTWRANVIGNVGLVLSRAVIGVSPLDHTGRDDSHVNCKRAKTENVTPFQLFEFIRVDSTSRLPAAHFYNTKDANERLSNLHRSNPKKRGLYNGANQPDAPIVACTDSSVIAVDDQAYVAEHQVSDDYLLITTDSSCLMHGVDLHYPQSIGQ